VVTGKAVSLKQFAGTPILLNFVNYGCSPSINNVVSAQLLAIKQLKQQRSDFMPVSVFCGCCPPDVLRQFAKQNNFDWPWILDTDYSIAAKYGNYLKKYSYPTLVFIDKAMVITEYTGAIDIPTLTKKIDNLVTN
jgi:peroxiredoxin